ncbi:MAG: hypothetical protein WBX11_15125 [Thiobacillaceae bacterium]
MYETMGYMSIWELAHRWVDADPMTPIGSPVPLTAQPILRALSHAVATGKLLASKPFYVDLSGVENETGGTEAIFDRFHSIPKSDGDVDALLSCAPNRAILDGWFVDLSDAFYWAATQKPPLDVPGFLIPEWAKAKHKGGEAAETEKAAEFPNSRRPMVEMLDKAMCQGAAIALWNIYPEMPIAQVCKHPAYLKAGAKNYVETTRRNWAHEVAPESVKNRRGRPSKKAEEQT